MTTPIEQCVADWHRCVRGELPGGLDAILDDDVVFLSPIVFTPQRGKEVTKVYLQAAGATIGDGTSLGTPRETAEPRERKFRYVKEIVGRDHAVLEFETEMDGKYVNGIDMITCNDAAKIVEFKVMIRPLQAINLVHAQMKAMLEQMQST
ncbi:MAG TPA: nuclear transport factor 2 family protein [Acidimicrobiia bacterium]|nr:nuclear transport factor 2 family protein [Acidimicrobiia bacterium]